MPMWVGVGWHAKRKGAYVEARVDFLHAPDRRMFVGAAVELPYRYTYLIVADASCKSLASQDSNDPPGRINQRLSFSRCEGASTDQAVYLKDEDPK